MSFAFAEGFHAGLDGSGEVGSGLGAVLGWVRHGADDLLDLAAEGAPGAALPTHALLFHPRPDIPAGDGLAVTGFVLVHGASGGGRPGLLVVRSGGREARVDLGAHDVPGDVPGALAAGSGGAAFDLLRLAAASPERLPLLGGGGRGLGPFARSVARLPRVAGAVDWFGDFRRVAAHRLPLGEVVLAGSFATAGTGEATGLSVLALVGAPDRDPRVVSPGEGTVLTLPEGFAARWTLRDLAEDDPVELIAAVTRGTEAWVFRIEPTLAAPGTALEALGLVGFDLPEPRRAEIEAWLPGALAARRAALEEALSRLSVLRAPPREGRATALLFDIDEPLAARVLALVAPLLEERFERIVLTGTAAGRAALALDGRAGLDVRVEPDAEAALRAAASSGGPVVPGDATTLANAAIRGDLAEMSGRGLDPARLDELLLLHDLAGTGTMAATLRRVLTLLEGEGAHRFVPPGGRTDPAGAAVAAHLGDLWRAAA